MINRKDLINFVPKPKNSDVIIYDITLTDLIDVDVFYEYNKLLPNYLDIKNRYKTLKEKLDQSIKEIDNMYLYNSSWGEKDYLLKLSDAKKVYSKLFGDVKKIENNITSLEKQITVANQKIELQKAKEENLIENSKKNVDERIEKNNQLLEQYRIKRNYFLDLLKRINKNIKENEEEFSILVDMQSHLQDKTFVCKYCGSKINITTENIENSHIYKRLANNIMDNKTELTNLLARQSEIKANKDQYDKEIKRIQAELTNDISLKSQDNVFYTKKSQEILKLEGFRDEMINNIDELKKQLKTKSETHTDKYLSLKKEIERYEISLDNLSKIKQLKFKNSDLITNIDKLKKELLPMHEKIEKYISFISIYFKIYEQKLTEFLGEDYKFNLFSFEDDSLKEILKITYKGLNYSDLSINEMENIDKYIYSKIQTFD